MADYQDIRGLRVKYLSADPSNTAAGEVWYNSTTGTLRSQLVTEAWSSGSPLATARGEAGAGGVPTAAWVAGGSQTPASSSEYAITEEYNGTGWSAGGDLINPRGYTDGTGVLTAGLIVGGYHSPPSPNGETFVEEYDGTSWTAATGTPVGLWQNSVFGIQTAAVSAGQEPGPVSAVFNYDGSSWTTGGTMNTTRGYATGAGTQTAGFLVGGWKPGGPPSSFDLHEQYNGSAWTVAPAVTTGSSSAGANGAQTSAIYFGGQTPSNDTNATGTFDGSSWTTSATMATATDGMGSANNGTSNSTALSAGGLTNEAAPAINITQEFNQSATVITPGAWAAGGVLNTGRNLGGSALPAQNSGIIFGGSGYTGATEQYNGSAWTTVPGSLNTARGYISGFGTETAAVCAGGYLAPDNPQSLVEEYNGSTWSEETNLPSTLKNAGNCGTLTAGLLMGGATAQPFAPNVVDTALEYDGTSWTATPGNMPVARGQGMSGGVQTAAFYAGGRTAPGYVATSVEYNGSTFSAGGDVAFGAGPPSGFQGSIGTLTAGLAASGSVTTNLVNTYDGTNWSTSPSYTTSRNRGMSGGTQVAAIIAGGSSSSTATEEFTGATTAANIETLTTS